jgi:hypothetical protein
MSNAQLLTPVEALDVPTCFGCGQEAVAQVITTDKLVCATHAHNHVFGPGQQGVTFFPGKGWHS